MIKYFLVTLFIVSSSCKKTTLKNSKGRSINFKEKSLYIDVLQKIYLESDYFISLDFNTSVAKSFYKEFHTNTERYIGALVSKTDNHERYKINDSVAEKYFSVNALDTLIVFDDTQQILDTLVRKNYEYLSDQIESQVIATYKKTNLVNENKDYLCISKSDFIFKKTTELKSHANYLKETLIKNSFKPSTINAHYEIIKDKDIISCISFGINTTEGSKEYFYLLKNKKVIDSLINTYSISKMIPVPISIKSEDLFVAYAHIPDTDYFWNSLVGIDLKNNKLKIYKSNRISIKSTDN